MYDNLWNNRKIKIFWNGWITGECLVQLVINHRFRQMAVEPNVSSPIRIPTLSISSFELRRDGEQVASRESRGRTVPISQRSGESLHSNPCIDLQRIILLILSIATARAADFQANNEYFQRMDISKCGKNQRRSPARNKLSSYEHRSELIAGF